MSPDPFVLTRIEAESPVVSLEFHETLDSTSSRALVLLREESVELPALVLAENQFAGRGRGTNQWHSGAGALTFSLAIEPSAALAADRLPIVSLVAGVAVCETLAKFLPAEIAIGLKWPNDVLLDGHKVCGILVESISVPSRRLVIGIGLNVNNDLAEVKIDGTLAPTSLARAASKQFVLTDILIELLVRLDERIASVSDANDSWREACRKYCVLTGRIVHLDAGSDTIAGFCKGIGPDGGLLLEQNGVAQSIYSATVARVE